LTEKQQAELADLKVKQDNGTKIVLSDTCIEYLLEEYSWKTVKKKAVSKEMDIEYTQKGRLAEDASITLLCRVDKAIYVKNTQRVNNEFLSGEPDIFLGPTIMEAEQIEDIKSIWDYPGFLKKIINGLDAIYDWQLKGYMDITGARKGNVANCLVDMPPTIINDYKRRLFYRLGVATDEAPEYKLAEAELVHSMTFQDIPMSQRVFKFPVEPFTPEQQQRVYDRVKVCREWLAEFHEQYQRLIP
jgi:hypothetical protein